MHISDYPDVPCGQCLETIGAKKLFTNIYVCLHTDTGENNLPSPSVWEVNIPLLAFIKRIQHKHSNFIATNVICN